MKEYYCHRFQPVDIKPYQNECRRHAQYIFLDRKNLQQRQKEMFRAYGTPDLFFPCTGINPAVIDP